MCTTQSVAQFTTCTYSRTIFFKTDYSRYKLISTAGSELVSSDCREHHCEQALLEIPPVKKERKNKESFSCVLKFQIYKDKTP